VLILAIGAGSVAAQQQPRERVRPVPDTGMVGIGGSVGIAPPREASFTNGLALTFNGEAYASPRVSLRGQLSGAWWDITGRHFTGTVQPVVLDGNVVYNWEAGAVHPFVTAGAGLYHYRFNEGATTGTANKPGLNVGGGAEFFASRQTTLTAEVLFHATRRPVTSPAATYYDARFWTLTAGLKRYF